MINRGELYGEWSEKEVDIFKQILRPGDIVYDVSKHRSVYDFFRKEGHW